VTKHDALLWNKQLKQVAVRVPVCFHTCYRYSSTVCRLYCLLCCLWLRSIYLSGCSLDTSQSSWY